MNKRFEYSQNDLINYISDNKTGIIYVATNYNDMTDMTKLLNKQAQRIAELESKLAESEQKANDWKQRFESSEERFKTFNSNGVTALNLKNEKIEKLKQQLAEKEKELFLKGKE